MRKLYVVLFLFSLIIFIGCAAVQDGGRAAGKKAPYIVFTVPANGQTKVQRSGNFYVEIYFSAEMDPTTKDFFMMTARGRRVEGRFFWLNGHTLQFRPDVLLEPNTSYECRITDGYSIYKERLRDIPFFWLFTTGP
ncbi:MAG: Ig-like domain-containing protein [Nitrospirota bacterium]